MNNKQLTFAFSARFALGLTGALCLVAVTTGQESPAPTKITFEDHVRPIFLQRCSSCHGGGNKEGDLDAINFTSLMLGGGSGEVIVPGSAADSYLYQLVTHSESPEMPPGGTKIPEPEIKTIADWINQGALENAGSKPSEPKPRLELSLSNVSTTRPEIPAFPLRLPLEPVVTTARPSITAVATSPWTHLAAVAAPKQILLYDTQTLELIGVLPMSEGLAHSLRFSRTGDLLLAGGGSDGESGLTIIWDVRKGERVASIGEELDTVMAADISSDHKLVAMGGPKKVVKVFSIAENSLIYEITKHTDWITALEFSPDGNYLATGDRNGGLIVWEAETGNELFVLKGHGQSISSVSWRSDSKILASASEDATVRTWEMSKGGQVKSWNAHGGGVTSLEFLRDGNLTTSGRDKLARSWDQNGKTLAEFSGLSDVAVASAYCDETNRIFAGDWSGQLLVWDAADGKMLESLVVNPPSLAARLELAEQNLAAARESHTPLTQELERTQSKLDEVTSSLAAVTESRMKIESEISGTASQLAALRQNLKATTVQLQQWQQELSSKTNALPLVEQTFTKAQEAADALPTDEDMKQSVAQLETKNKQIEARITELGGLITQANEENSLGTSQIEGLTESLQSGQNELEQTNSRVAELESEMSRISQQLEQQSAAAAKAGEAVDAAHQQVNRWNGEIEFINQWNLLSRELAETRKTAQQQQSVVDQAEEKLAAAQRLVDGAKQQQQANNDQATKLQQQILQLRNRGNK